MNSISVFLSDSPAILPIVFAVLLTAVSVAGAYAYRVNKQINKEGQSHDYKVLFFGCLCCKKFKIMPVILSFPPFGPG